MTGYPRLVPSAVPTRVIGASGWTGVVVRFDDRLDKGRFVAECPHSHKLARTAVSCAERLTRGLVRASSRR